MNNFYRLSLMGLFITLLALSGCKSDEFVSKSLIQKRKHLKGYHLKSTPSKSTDFHAKSNRSEESASDNGYKEVDSQTHATTEVAESKQIQSALGKVSQKDLNSRLASKKANRATSRQAKLDLINPQTSSYSPLLKTALSKASKENRSKPNDISGIMGLSPDDSAILGVIAGYLGVTLLFGFWTAPLSVLFGIVGLIFSIRGLKGDEFRVLAIIGLVGSILAILVGLGLSILLVFLITSF